MTIIKKALKNKEAKKQSKKDSTIIIKSTIEECDNMNSEAGDIVSEFLTTCLNA